MGTMVKRARERGFAWSATAPNASDPGPDRPGLRAVREHGVWSPLLELGIRKDEVRELARELGLSVAEKPANARLSSRIPHGQLVTLGKLRAVERAEELLLEAGFEIVRVRHEMSTGRSTARVEVGSREIERLRNLWSHLEPGLRECGFATAELDPVGYQRGGADGGRESAAEAPGEPHPSSTPSHSVAAGETPPADALERLAESPFADLGFARLDLHRELRSGLPEAVFGQGKQPEDLVAICRRLMAAHERVLVTRVEPTGAEALCAALAEATWHPRARVLTCGTPHVAKNCTVAVLVAGTSDLPVAEEAAVCAEWFGLRVERHIDVGIAGVHRVLERLTDLRRCDVAIAVAGMDGALPTLIAGLLSVPVIAVPTSVGYGASFQGLAALLTMLNACAPGVAVMNIDNGYGASVLAQRIAARMDHAVTRR